MDVYVLFHFHDLEDLADAKIIGIYSSREDADDAKRRAVQMPGFKESPDGFHIDPYTLDMDNWSHGFETVDRFEPTSSEDSIS
jgi:hypothetical protein